MGDLTDNLVRFKFKQPNNKEKILYYNLQLKNWNRNGEGDYNDSSNYLIYKIFYQINYLFSKNEYLNKALIKNIVLKDDDTNNYYDSLEFKQKLFSYIKNDKTDEIEPEYVKYIDFVDDDDSTEWLYNFIFSHNGGFLFDFYLEYLDENTYRITDIFISQYVADLYITDDRKKSKMFILPAPSNWNVNIIESGIKEQYKEYYFNDSINLINNPQHFIEIINSMKIFTNPIKETIFQCPICKKLIKNPIYDSKNNINDNIIEKRIDHTDYENIDDELKNILIQYENKIIPFNIIELNGVDIYYVHKKCLENK